MHALAVDLAWDHVVPAARARPRGLRPPEPVPLAAQTMFWPGWGPSPMPNVTESAVLGLPAAWRAVNLIANGVAAMAPPRVLRPDGVTDAGDTFPIVDRPNAMLTVTEFWHMAAAHALTTGNFVGILADPDPVTGFPRQAVPVNSRLVSCMYDRDGFPDYMIGGRHYSADEVVHVRALVSPGDPWGVGPVTAFRRALGGHLNQQLYSAETYRTGAVPPGVIKVAKPEISPEQAKDVQDQWIDAHGDGQRRPAVLPELFDFQPIAWSPEDAQFLEARQFSVAEAAFMFGLDPSDLSASVGGPSLTYANISQRITHRVVEAYGPWVARFEDAWSDLVPGGNLVRFRRENLTHASRSDLFAEQAAGIAAGVLTVDEARAELNKPPIPAPSALTLEGAP